MVANLVDDDEEVWDSVDALLARISPGLPRRRRWLDGEKQLELDVEVEESVLLVSSSPSSPSVILNWIGISISFGMTRSKKGTHVLRYASRLTQDGILLSHKYFMNESEKWLQLRWSKWYRSPLNSLPISLTIWTTSSLVKSVCPIRMVSLLKKNIFCNETDEWAKHTWTWTYLHRASKHL